jgi:hypothetical protein
VNNIINGNIKRSSFTNKLSNNTQSSTSIINRQLQPLFVTIPLMGNKESETNEAYIKQTNQTLETTMPKFVESANQQQMSALLIANIKDDANAKKPAFIVKRADPNAFPKVISTTITLQNKRPDSPLGNTNRKSLSPQAVRSLKEKAEMPITDSKKKETAKATEEGAKTTEEKTIALKNDSPLKNGFPFPSTSNVPFLPVISLSESLEDRAGLNLVPKAFDVIVSVEHCSDCELHNNQSLRHDTKKYVQMANDTIFAIISSILDKKFAVRLFCIRVKPTSVDRYEINFVLNNIKS